MTPDDCADETEPVVVGHVRYEHVAATHVCLLSHCAARRVAPGMDFFIVETRLQSVGGSRHAITV